MSIALLSHHTPPSAPFPIAPSSIHLLHPPVTTRHYLSVPIRRNVLSPLRFRPTNAPFPVSASKTSLRTSVIRFLPTFTMSDTLPPPVPRPPSVASSSSASSHALDFSFDHRPSSSVSSSAHNTADETAHFNLNPVGTLRYHDYDQDVYKRSDSATWKERSKRRLITTILKGRAMPVKPLFFAIFWAVSAVLITWGTSRNYGPHEKGECRWWCTPLAIDGDALSYVGFALFLLTSFRASEAYSRYMEAVRVWTSIGGTITSFAKYVCQAFPENMFHPGDRERILGFLVAFPVTLKRELRGELDLRELKGILSQADLAQVQHSASMPSHCLYMLSRYLLHAQANESKLPQTFLVHLIRWIADLAGAADVCVQIKTMPAPYSYITHLNTFLALWLFFLPFALVETTGWLTIVIVAFISYGILGVVANAAELEDPFGSDFNDLPLGRFADSITQSVAAIYHAASSEDEFLTRQGRKYQELQQKALRESDGFWLQKKDDDSSS